jgi:hypothetical protein
MLEGLGAKTVFNHGQLFGGCHVVEFLLSNGAVGVNVVAPFLPISGTVKVSRGRGYGMAVVS